MLVWWCDNRLTKKSYEVKLKFSHSNNVESSRKQTIKSLTSIKSREKSYYGPFHTSLPRIYQHKAQHHFASLSTRSSSLTCSGGICIADDCKALVIREFEKCRWSLSSIGSSSHSSKYLFDNNIQSSYFIEISRNVWIVDDGVETKAFS